MRRLLSIVAVFAVISAITIAAQQDPLRSQASPALPTKLPPKTVRVNGANLAYVEQGRGQLVILIHGFLMDYRAWSAQIPELSKNYRVIAYSMRHRWPHAPKPGAAGPPASEFSSSVNSADLAAFIRELKLAPVHVVGHSGGARQALLLARDHPELVRTIVLGEPGGGAFAVRNPTVRPAYTQEHVNQVRQAYERGDLESALEIVRRQVVGEEAARQPQKSWVRQMVLDNAWHLTSLWTHPPRDPERDPPVTCEQARGIHAPALLLGGDKSRPVFRAVFDELEKCLPRAQREILTGATHGLQLDQPAAYNRIVLEFLAKHSAP